MKILKIYKNLILESMGYGFFKESVGIPVYDSILQGDVGRIPSGYRDWVGEVRFMSMEEYLGECAKIQGTSYAEQFRLIMDENIKEIEERMEEGIKYDMPYLNYVKGDQEGRHRVIAASNLGQKKIPVLILFKR